ncbi:MAG: tetratricopeptide repeat protein [Tannerellaceae bacterium]|jgi:tetratricopeptide (TPR) repeat protein|nr:tetratricopeptide repeat protein [Tannerellaceae bacterium]
MRNFFKSLFSSAKPENTPGTIAKTDRKNFDIFKYDGIRAQRMGHIPYAIKCFTAALDIQDDFETMNYLVAAYISSHDFDNASTLANRMVELEPASIPARLTRVNVLFLIDKEKEAMEDCLYILSLDKSNYAAWFLLGKAKKATHDLAGAVSDLTRAVALKEDFTDAYLLRAEVFMEMNRPTEALPDIEKAIELAPGEESVYLLRGQIHEKTGDFSAAADDYKQVLELNPFNADASLFSAILLINTGKLEEAISFLDEVIELKPDFAKAYDERARAKELSGDKEGAGKDKKTAEELIPGKEEAAKQSGFDDMYKGGIY